MSTSSCWADASEQKCTVTVYFWSLHGLLLQLDGGAGAFELGLGLLGLLLGDLLEDGLRRAVDQVLGLLQAEVGQGAHLLDHRDLLGAHLGQDDVELVLLLLDGSGLGAATATGGGDGHGSSGGHAELLLEVLEELGQLQNGHAGDAVEDLFLGGHYWSPSSDSGVSCGGVSTWGASAAAGGASDSRFSTRAESP